MSPQRHPSPLRRRARGASLIEIMVGVVIGLIAILVIYQVFAVSEGLRRNTTGVTPTRHCRDHAAPCDRRPASAAGAHLPGL